MGIVISEGDCFDEAWFTASFGVLEEYRKQLKKGRVEVFCASVTTSIATSNQGESCVQILLPENLPTLRPDQQLSCCFMYSSQAGLTGQAATISLEVSQQTVSVKCGGSTISSNNGSIYSSGMAVFNCDPSDEFQLCASLRYKEIGHGALDNFSNLSGQISICGCILCFVTTAYDIDRSFYTPPPATPGCCYGLEAMALIGQNLNAVREYFNFPGYTARCEFVSHPTGASAQVGPEFENPAKWMAFGCTNVDYEGLWLGDGVTANASGGCGSNYQSCPTQRFVRDWDGPQNLLGTGTAQFSHVLCGTCETGETLFMGAQGETDCVAQQIVSEEPYDPVVTAGTTEWCVFIFDQINNTNEIPVVPFIRYGCVDMNFGQGVTDACAAIDGIAAEFKVPEKVVACGSGAVPNGGSGVVIPGVPDIWTPAGLPIPMKKRAVLGFITASANNPQTEGYEENVYIRWSFVVQCGGTVKPGGERIWKVQGSGINNPNGPGQIICACLDCLVTDDVVVIPNGASGFGPFFGTLEFTFQACAFCAF